VGAPLGPGGTRGFAHLGVIKTLLDAGVQIHELEVHQVIDRASARQITNDAGEGVVGLDRLGRSIIAAGALAEVVAHFKERGGFVWVPWCGDAECEERVKAEAGGVTVRTVDPDENASGQCFVCGKPARHRVALAKAY